MTSRSARSSPDTSEDLSSDDAERFAALLRAELNDRLIAAALRATVADLGAERPLAIELGALRLAILRIVAVDLPSTQATDQSQPLARLVDAALRARNAERALGGGNPAGDLLAATDRVLVERGYKDREAR